LQVKLQVLQPFHRFDTPKLQVRGQVLGPNHHFDVQKLQVKLQILQLAQQSDSQNASMSIQSREDHYSGQERDPERYPELAMYGKQNPSPKKAENGKVAPNLQSAYTAHKSHLPSPPRILFLLFQPNGGLDMTCKWKSVI
jgi:hypothetical protein